MPLRKLGQIACSSTQHLALSWQGVAITSFQRSSGSAGRSTPATSPFSVVSTCDGRHKSFNGSSSREIGNDEGVERSRARHARHEMPTVTTVVARDDACLRMGKLDAVYTRPWLVHAGLVWCYITGLGSILHSNTFKTFAMKRTWAAVAAQ